MTKVKSEMSAGRHCPCSERNKEARSTHSTSGRVQVKANPDFKKLESGDGMMVER